MNEITKHPVFIAISLLLIAVGALLLSLFQTENRSEPLQSAYEAYTAGEKATTVSERKKNFNKALELYSQFDNSEADGRLLYDIGNTYFQLDEYPYAIYYYERALALRPNDEKIHQNLRTALSKTGNQEDNQPTIWQQVFYPHYHYSLPDRLRLFFFSGLAFLAFISAYIWYKQKWLWNLIILSALAFLFFMCSTLYSLYLAPLQGIMVQSALLYRDAGTEYAKVKEEPLPGGSKVQVLSITHDGTWLKIMTQDGTLGYIPQKSIKLL